MTASRRALVALLAAFFMLGGCGEGGLSAVGLGAGPTPQTGVWLNIYDKENDRIEILSSNKAKVTVLFGKDMGAWIKLTPAQSEFGQQIQDAEKALAVYQQIEVSYEVDAKNDLITFKSDTRGSRTLEWNGSDIMGEKGSIRTYLHQK